jgi:hypothetical protein
MWSWLQKLVAPVVFKPSGMADVAMGDADELVVVDCAAEEFVSGVVVELVGKTGKSGSPKTGQDVRRMPK